MNLIVWGTGHDYENYKDKLEGHNIILVDSDINKQGRKLDNIYINSPEIIGNTDYDYLIVATSKAYIDIVEILTVKFHVQEEKVFFIGDADNEILMRKIGHRKFNNLKVEKKILFGYCFLIYENCRLHDFLLAESLRRRGAEIVPLSCGGLQEMQCSVYGGVWGNDTSDEELKKKNHLSNCKKCLSYDKKVWEYWGNYKIVDACNYLNENYKKEIRTYIDSLDIKEYKEWNFMGYPIGIWALKTYFNINLISSISCFDENEEKEFRSLAYNVAIMCVSSENAVNEINPEVIYSNDSFYYPYCILEFIAKKKGIPFYNAYGYNKKNTYTYAKNAATAIWPLDDAWSMFSQRNLTESESRFIDNYLYNSRYGKDLLVNTADPVECVKKLNGNSIYGKLDIGKKTALMATNLTWDNAALMRDRAFKSIEEWVLATVAYFENNSQWQLVIRCHPAELYKSCPIARERIAKIILDKYKYTLPSNIVLIDSDAPISIYDLYPKVDLGLVYTTTCGLEMSCLGIPVIVAGKAPYSNKGFTYDPINEEEYYDYIERVLSCDEYIKNSKIQAKKFLLLYFFIDMIPNPFYTFSWENGAEFLSYDENILNVGRNEAWDYICDSIMEGKDIISAHRLPPYSV